jgi:hypothetical protein
LRVESVQFFMKREMERGMLRGLKRRAEGLNCSASAQAAEGLRALQRPANRPQLGQNRGQ